MIKPFRQNSIWWLHSDLESSNQHIRFSSCVEHVPQVSVIETTRGNAPMESYWWYRLNLAKIATKSLLHAQHIPSVGGDTIWCSMTAVFDSVDEDMKVKPRLSATHSVALKA